MKTSIFKTLMPTIRLSSSLKAAMPAITLSLLGILIIGVPLACNAQVVDTTGLDAWQPFEGPITVDKLLNIFDPLYGGLVIVWGYVAKAFNLKSKKVPFVFVVLAGALVAAGVFLTQGVSAIGLIISFFAALGIFDLFLKPAEKAIKARRVTREKPVVPSS